LPCDLEFGAPPQPPQEVKQFTQELKDRLKQIHELVRENLEIASDQMKARYDICADDFKFEPHNKVCFYKPQRKKGRSPKLQCKWKGPWIVVKQISGYCICQGRKFKVVHRNRLAPWSPPFERDVQS